MNKYLIVNFVYGEELLSEIHDIEIDPIAEKCKKIRNEANKLGVEVFFKDSVNDRAISNSFALVEHNFELSSGEKAQLVNALTIFFNDAIITKGCLNIDNTLKAVRFLKTDGELFTVK